MATDITMKERDMNFSYALYLLNCYADKINDPIFRKAVKYIEDHEEYNRLLIVMELVS